MEMVQAEMPRPIGLVMGAIERGMLPIPVN